MIQAYLQFPQSSRYSRARYFLPQCEFRHGPKVSWRKYPDIRPSIWCDTQKDLSYEDWCKPIDFPTQDTHQYPVQGLQVNLTRDAAGSDKEVFSLPLEKRGNIPFEFDSEESDYDAPTRQKRMELPIEYESDANDNDKQRRRSRGQSSNMLDRQVISDEEYDDEKERASSTGESKSGDSTYGSTGSPSETYKSELEIYVEKFTSIEARWQAERNPDRKEYLLNEVFQAEVDYAIKYKIYGNLKKR